MIKQIWIAERDALRDQRAILGPQLDTARRAQPGPMRRRELFDELERRRTEFLDKARYATAGAQKLQEQYAELGRDRGVAVALKTLRATAKSRRVGLGPSPGFRNAYREFVNAVKGAKTADELMRDAMNARQNVPSRKTRAR